MRSGSAYIPPGSTVGIIGGGQLGRMTAIAAAQMGYLTAVLDPDPCCPAGQVASRVVAAPYADLDAARELAGLSAAVTYEFENVDLSAVEAAASVRPVHPSPEVLRVCQDRLLEKAAATGAGAEVAPYAAVRTQEDLRRAVDEVGLPAVIKTATMGYDGKGQAVVRSAQEAEQAFGRLAGRSRSLIYERFVDYSMELSVICARDAGGQAVCFPPSENVHRDNILDVSIVPARVDADTAGTAQALAEQLAESLAVVGLLCVEMFLARDGTLLVNELAPRPHNSGHWSIEGCETSQFAQLVRALCGLPLGPVGVRTPTVMANLLGEVWLETGGRPAFGAALAVPGVNLHLYGKAEARKGRKMGHITAQSPDVDTALSRALEARTALVRK